MRNTIVVPATQALQGDSGLALASDIATVVIAAAVLALLFLAGLLFWRVSAILKDLRRTVGQNLAPVTDRAGRISDNLEFITQSLRTDVEKLNASVRSLSDRLQLASERMEERIEDFNALMEVVQGEAEDVFLDTASTVRGVREGARAITSRADARREDGAPAGERFPDEAARVSPRTPEDPSRAHEETHRAD